MSEIGFINFQKKIVNLLDECANILAEEDGFVERIQAGRKRLNRETMSVLIIGEFSRGKSTFINAMLSEPVLPSKVNPTTATVNIIKSGPIKSMKIFYQGGTVEDIALPTKKVNKFLDQFVTTLNKDIAQIDHVEIFWPGFLTGSNSLIVDTPGVNDLDDVREEITYKYLSQADACVMVLDCQQPLSESERRFLTDKVLASDINRILFVINRVDEVDQSPSGETVSRLKSYVTNLLQKNIPEIADPQVFAVSSKQALRGRFKGESSVWTDDFKAFEQRLLDFISCNATQGRLPEHLWRLQNIVQDGIFTLRERQQLLNLTDSEVKKQIEKLKIEERKIETRLQNLTSILNRKKVDLSISIKSLVEHRFNKLKQQLLTTAEQMTGEEDLIQTKSRISEDVRNIINDLNSLVFDFKRDIFTSESFLSKTNYAIQKKIPQLDQLDQLKSFESTATVIENDIETIGTNMLVGSALGYICGALFGPIGIAAAIVGGGYLGNIIEEKNKAKQLEQARQLAVAKVRMEINKVLINCKNAAVEIANNEVENIERYFSERANSRIQSLKSTIETQRGDFKNEVNCIEIQRNLLNERCEKIENILSEIKILEGQIQNGH